METPNNPDFSLTMEVCDRSLTFTYHNTWVVQYTDPAYVDHSHIWHQEEGVILIFDSDDERATLIEYGWEPVPFEQPSELVKATYRDYKLTELAHEEAANLDGEIAAFYDELNFEG